jgi:hypothetical protein
MKDPTMTTTLTLPETMTLSDGTTLAETLVSLISDSIDVSEYEGGFARVAIWELRDLVNALAPNEVSRDVFDRAVMDLDYAGLVRVVAIGDRSKATSEQLRVGSITGCNETFFWVYRA